jgi:hypothetical protein
MVERIRLIGPLNGCIELHGSLDCRQLALALPILAKPPEINSEHTENGCQRQATSDCQPDDQSVSIRKISERAFHVIA